MFRHDNITGTCTSCHNGSTARGKHSGHLQTTSDCDNCHTTRAWTPANFHHDNISGRCDGCHNGKTATGKHTKHIPTTADCETCHSTVAWKPANFHHDNITGRCDACHNGTTATGKPGGHPTTTADCVDCHNTATWGGAVPDHGSITGGCSGCHNNKAATGTSSSHIVTARECNECHTTTAWSPNTFAHTSAAYPGNHKSSVTCFKCHVSKTETANWTTAQYKPDCAGCHAGDFKQDAHKKDANGTKYLVSELVNCAGSCHKEGVPVASHHRVNAGGW
jgi:hypothetical protein